MIFLISIFFNYISQFKWYIDLIVWLFIKVLEGVTGFIVVMATFLLVCGWLLLIGSTIAIIIAIIIAPKLLSNYYGNSSYNWLFILSIPIGIILFMWLADRLESR